MYFGDINMNKPKNYIFKTDNTEMIKVFEKYFDKECISLGSMCRKLPFILMELSNINSEEWFLRVKFDKFRERFLTTVASQSTVLVEIENSVEMHGTKIGNSLHVLNEMFDNDKRIIKTPCSHGIAEFLYSKCKYRYEKIRYSDDYMFVFKIQKLTGLLNTIKSWLTSSSETISDVTVIKSDSSKIIAN